VINFDIPKKRSAKGNYVMDEENYLHRIGRTGRFNSVGIAINLHEHEEDLLILY